MAKGICPKCGSAAVSYQIVQTGSVGASTNKVVIEAPKKTHGLLYYISCIWIFKAMYWLTFGWIKRLLFGGRRRGGLNLNVNKNKNKTMAVCQNCGHTWQA